VDNLRLILILIGIVILALIVLLHRPAGETRRNHARWREAHRERREPRLGDVGDDDDDDRDPEPERQSTETAALWAEDRAGSETEPPVAEKRPNPGGAPATVPSTPDKIVYLYICRRDERRINGSDLLDAAIKAGLNFGEMNIFHRRQEGVKQPVFSMANLTKPGSFDPGS
jgi:cell division protein ZipA